MFTILSNGSIIPPGFKFMELHTLTLAARSYALLVLFTGVCIYKCPQKNLGPGWESNP